MRFFCKCLRENFSSPLSYAAIVVFAVFCVFGLTVQLDDETTYSMFEIFLDKEIFNVVTSNSQCSSYLMALKYGSSEWYAVGMSVLTAVPALYTYIKSLEKVQIFTLVRTNFSAYSVGIILSSFVTGFIITLSGTMLFFGAVYLIFPSLESFSDPMLLLIYSENAAQRFGVLTERVINHAFVGGLMPVFAITLYRYIRSDFLAATIPMMLMYVSTKTLPNYREWLSSDAERSQNVFLSFLLMLFPSNLASLTTWLKSYNAPFWLAYIGLEALVFVNFLLFKKSVRRA